MEYDYNIIVPVRVTAGSQAAAEETIINNLSQFVLENKERITVRRVRIQAEPGDRSKIHVS